MIKSKNKDLYIIKYQNNLNFNNNLNLNFQIYNSNKYKIGLHYSLILFRSHNNNYSRNLFQHTIAIAKLQTKYLEIDHEEIRESSSIVRNHLPTICSLSLLIIFNLLITSKITNVRERTIRDNFSRKSEFIQISFSRHEN